MPVSGAHGLKFRGLSYLHRLMSLHSDGLSWMPLRMLVTYTFRRSPQSVLLQVSRGSVGCGPAPLWGALWGLHGDCGSYVCSSDSSCTAASCLPPPEEEEAECGGVLPRKHTQGPGFDLSQAPPTSRVCLSAFKPAYSSPHTLAVPKLNAISPHFAASKPPACRTQPPV